MKRDSIIRIAIDLVVLLSLLKGFWPVIIVVSIFGLFKYSNFIEIILAGIIYDSLFSSAVGENLEAYIGTVSGLGIFLITQLIRRLIRK